MSTCISLSHVSGSLFPLGATLVTATGFDANGNLMRGTFTVTVVDGLAPAFSSLSSSPNTLTTPNHTKVAVVVSASVSDAVDLAPTTQILSVTSNEATTDTGDGDTGPDWEITGALTLNLRAERSNYGTGRIYTITVESRDATNNASTETVTVTVPPTSD